jgi:hypothetical protein
MVVTDDVERATRLEPLDLPSAEGVHAPELELTASGLGDAAAHRSVRRQRPKVEHRDPIVLADGVVGRRIFEREGQQALLLQVRLVDTGSRREFDGGDDRRFEALRERLVLEVQLERLAQVGERLFDGVSLAGNLDFKAARDLPGAFVRDRSREPHDA